MKKCYKKYVFVIVLQGSSLDIVEDPLLTKYWLKITLVFTALSLS